MISSSMTGRLLRTMDQNVDFPLGIQLNYDEDDNPLSIQMIISTGQGEEVVWEFGRDLLIRGKRSITPYGHGDVRFRYDPLGHRVLACLTSEEGHADLGISYDDVDQFIVDTLYACPLGEEEVDSHIDELIEEIYNA